MAEGYGRNSKQDDLRVLIIARGFKNQVEPQLQICPLLECLHSEEIAYALDLCKEVSKMLTALINSLSNQR